MPSTAAAVLLLSAASFGQRAELPAPDPFGLTRLQDFRAFRASNKNPDLQSNDDSKRPIPGETVALADLAGPGVVTHIWPTAAANECGWPRLLRLQVYYDGGPFRASTAP